MDIYLLIIIAMTVISGLYLLFFALSTLFSYLSTKKEKKSPKIRGYLTATTNPDIENMG